MFIEAAHYQQTNTHKLIAVCYLRTGRRCTYSMAGEQQGLMDSIPFLSLPEPQMFSI